MKHNLFIALEGIDGSGKSSQSRLLAQRLTAAGHKVYATFEPTDGMVGSMIRGILKGEVQADHRTIAGLFLADRLDHLLNAESGLVKKMEDGYTIVSDRYYFSSYAYHALHMNMDWVIAANKICTTILRPDITVFIDVAPETCMERIMASRGQTELFEKLETLRQVRGLYLQAFGKLQSEERIAIVDGNREIADIAADIWKQVSVIAK